jgi:hypothetical protein
MDRLGNDKFDLAGCLADERARTDPHESDGYWDSIDEAEADRLRRLEDDEDTDREAHRPP